MSRASSLPNYLPPLLLLTGVVILAIGLILWFPKFTKPTPRENVTPSESPSPTLTPTPIALAASAVTYQISQSKHAGPSITEVEFDPLDIHKGQSLTLQVHVVNAVQVNSVRATLKTDSSTQPIEFRKINEEGNDSYWQGSVIPDQTLWYTYILYVEAVAVNGTSRVTVAPRSL